MITTFIGIFLIVSFFALLGISYGALLAYILSLGCSSNHVVVQQMKEE